MSIKSHNHWIKEIRKYVGDKTDEEIIKFSLSYTLQSLRAEEDFNRFKWSDNNEKNEIQKKTNR